jgi:hypothetical protein
MTNAIKACTRHYFTVREGSSRRTICINEKIVVFVDVDGIPSEMIFLIQSI